MFNLFSQPKTYLEITNDKIFAAKLKKSGNKFFLQNSQIQKIQDLQILDGAIFNPSEIYLFINSFLAQNNLAKPQTIICLPSLDDDNDEENDLKLFQIALISCKAGLKIHKIISKSLFN